jgi:hypothetical protein
LQNEGLLVHELVTKLEKLPLELKKAVRGWTGKDAYLVALKLTPEIVLTNIPYIVDIYTSSRAKANQYKQIHQWAL